MTEYRVHLANFDGPLDLLLHLIRKAEVDVTDIPIAEIADQYVHHISDVDRLDIELAGEFLLMAATLMEIKSRMLAPVESRRSAHEGDDADDDPRADLVRQLLEYKAYRDAADALDSRREEWERRMGSAKAGFDAKSLVDDEDLDLGDVDLLDLVRAFETIAESVNFDRLGEHQVFDDDTPIELHAADILERLRARASGGKLTLRDMLEGRTRSEMIGLFLATLELCRRREVVVTQDETGPIVIVLRPPEPDPGEDAAAEAPQDATAAHDDD